MILKTAKQAYISDLCIGCGLCKYVDNSVEMEEKNGKLLPNKIPTNTIIDKVCPSLGYDLKNEGLSIFNNKSFRNEIGSYNSIYLSHSNDASLLRNASSGGVISQIALFLLEKHMVDGVICTKFEMSNLKVRPKTIIATNKEDIVKCQGSKYCPTDTLSILKKISKEKNKKYLLIATPCQIAGFRLAAKQYPELNKIIFLTIANFCGGYRDFREIDYFIKKIAKFSNVSFFRHRGGGQPGSMLIKDNNANEFCYPYPDYAKLSPFLKVERCTLCMDATGELADISCGDAWLNRIEKSQIPWSILIARSKLSVDLINMMKDNGCLTLNNNITENEVVESQKFNIESKKNRQFKRIMIRHIMLKRSPNWNNNYYVREGSYLNEIKILLSKVKSKYKEPKND